MSTIHMRLPLLALMLVAAGLAVTKASLNNTAAHRFTDIRYFELSDASQPMLPESYTEISAATYNALSCATGKATVCKIQAESDGAAFPDSHPLQLVDNNLDGLPDIDGAYVKARTLRANP